MKIWHPFTQEKTASEPLKIVGGNGARVVGADGKQYLDMISSWWTNILGHAQREIADSISEQAHTLEHVIFAGFTHEPAEKLRRDLSQFLSGGLEYFFFSDNGSTAVEVALKMAYQYFSNMGSEGRNVYVNLDGGYHGDTLGAMSAAGKNSAYHSTFAEFFFETFSIDFPVSGFCEEAALRRLVDFLKVRGDKVCALIIEPLVQGAAGMRMYSAEFLEVIVSEIRKFGALVIFDEVMTGFGRTGTMFAMDQLDCKPDIICLSKGITGGFMPLALTVTTRQVYEAFWSDDPGKALMHGHSYTANPIACAAAIKAIEILAREKTQTDIRMIADMHTTHLPSLENVTNKRSLGTIAAFDVASNETARKLAKSMLEAGVIIRPINNAVYLMPPYCTSKADLQSVYELLGNLLKP